MCVEYRPLLKARGKPDGGTPEERRISIFMARSEMLKSTYAGNECASSLGPKFYNNQIGITITGSLMCSYAECSRWWGCSDGKPFNNFKRF